MAIKRFQITVPEQIFNALESQSKKQGVSKSTFILMVLNQHFSDLEKKEKRADKIKNSAKTSTDLKTRRKTRTKK